MGIFANLHEIHVCLLQGIWYIGNSPIHASILCRLGRQYLFDGAFCVGSTRGAIKKSSQPDLLQ